MIIFCVPAASEHTNVKVRFYLYHTASKYGNKYFLQDAPDCFVGTAWNYALTVGSHSVIGTA